MDEDWSHDRFMGGKAAIANRNVQVTQSRFRSESFSIEPAQQQLSFEACPNLSVSSCIVTQVFVGGLDPSLDKDTLVKLFGLIPNMVSVEMDMDSKNQFKVGFVINSHS